MRAKRRMSESDFEMIRPSLRISSDRIDAARAALVGNETFAAIGARYNWSRQSVNDAVTVVWRTLERHRIKQAESGVILPPDWDRVTIVAPKYLIERFRVEIDKVSAQIQRQ